MEYEDETLRDKCLSFLNCICKRIYFYITTSKINSLGEFHLQTKTTFIVAVPYRWKIRAIFNFAYVINFCNTENMLFSLLPFIMRLV